VAVLGLAGNFWYGCF